MVLVGGCTGAIPSVYDTAYLKSPVTCTQKITFYEARHLLARTGFGVADPAEIQALLPLCYEQAVNTILLGVRPTPQLAPPQPEISPGQRTRVKSMTAAERKAYNKANREEVAALKQWWIREMLETDSPLTERLVVFWHGHFATESRKVKFAEMMLDQHVALRHNAMGSFDDLLTDVAKGAAMLFYLDGQKNVKGRPNENFAREVMELHSMGEGNSYTETDVREGARAFTGWKVDMRTGKFRFNFKNHDRAAKTYLGKSGYLDGDDILEIILEQPDVAEFITGKLWREFVSPDPNLAEVRRLAASFRDSGYRLGPLLKGLLMTPQFRDPANRGALIKSPVELVIGTLRLLRFAKAPPERIHKVQRKLGQDLLDPPDVNGWRGGGTWITTTSTLFRRQFLRSALRSAKPNATKRPYGTPNPAALLALARTSPQTLRKVMVALDPVMPASTKGRALKLIESLLLDPVYQLK